MRIAIVHYHLQPGGVTRVIEHAARSLASLGARVALLYGGGTCATDAAEFPGAALSGLAYSAGPGRPAELARRMRLSARRLLGGPPDVWHIHNHALGKNPALTAASSWLAERGERLLLQIHDFAEDGRPAEFQSLARHLVRHDFRRLGRAMYPQNPRVHYAVLNTRDAGFLKHAGVPEERLHLLPNPVALPASDSQRQDDSAGSCWLYPTRAIRRKNLGEFLLLAALAPPGARFAVTLAPNNPAARPVYAAWVQLSHKLKLPLAFEVGRRTGADLQTLLSEAAAAVTTSVGEGFGMAFLEPWMAGCPVAGRDLPEITQMFKNDGVDLSGLYRSLDIPVEWVGLPSLRRRIHAGLRALYDAYGRAPGRGDLESAVAAAIRGNLVDFARLDEPMQAVVLRELAAGRLSAHDIAPTANFLRHDPRRNLRQIAVNKRIIQRNYNPGAYARRLENIFSDLMSVPAGGTSDAEIAEERLLDDFLAPERFCLLRT